MTYLLKNVRAGKSRTGEWYEGGLYYGEQQIATVAFDGNGSPAFIDWLSSDARDQHFSNLHKWAFARSYDIPEGTVLNEHDIAETLYLVWLNNKRSKDHLVTIDTPSSTPLDAQVTLNYGMDLEDKTLIRNLLELFPTLVYWDVKSERFVPLVRIFRD